jgi:hypothetical protein
MTNYRYMDDPYGPIDLSKGPIGIRYRVSYFIKSFMGYLGCFLLLVTVLSFSSSIFVSAFMVVLTALLAIAVFWTIYGKLRIARTGTPALVLSQDGFTSSDIPARVNWHEVQSVVYRPGIKWPGALYIEYLPGPHRLKVESASLACSFSELLKVFQTYSGPISR